MQKVEQYGDFSCRHIGVLTVTEFMCKLPLEINGNRVGPVGFVINRGLSHRLGFGRAPHVMVLLVALPYCRLQ